MADLTKAKELLSQGYTCVLVKDGKVLSSKAMGIAPMMTFLDGEDMRGFSLADKIVGRAVSFLALKAGVKEVYGEVMSEGALKLLKENNIQAEYKTLTPNIINRKGDDICPMEKAVKDCNDFEEAYILLQYKLKEIKTNMQATKII